MSRSSAQNERILVMARSPATQESVKRVLSSCVHLLVCEDLEGALQLLQEDDFDLVIAEARDGGLPLLLDAVSGSASGTDWLILAESALAEVVVQAREAGAVDCLLQPVGDASLRRAVDRALENSQLRAENARLRSNVRTMEDSRQLVLCLEPDKLYPMALDLLLQMTSRGRGLALFRREAAPQNDSIAVRGFSESETRSICRVLLEEKPVDLDAFDRIEVVDRGALHEGLRRAGIEVGVLLVVPLDGAENEAGLLCFFEEGREFTAGELEHAGIVASHAAAALRNAETYSLAKERAFIDDVTEAYNARYLLATTDNEIQRAERYGNPLSILFLDLDRFKLVNDRYGHLVGSETLRRLAKLLAQCVRQVDTLARYGGDEFTIVLVDTDHPEALVIAERIRRTIEEFVFEAARDDHLRLTISIGVSSCPEHGASRDSLLDSADKAMYRAKSEGRNRVCSASSLA